MNFKLTYTLSCIFGCCCPVRYNPERPDLEREDPNFRRNTEVIHIPGQQKIGGAMSLNHSVRELDDEEHEVLYECDGVVSIKDPSQFDVHNQRDMYKDGVSFNLVPKAGITLEDWTEYANEMQKVHEFERDIFDGVLYHERRERAEEKLDELKAKVSDKFDVEIKIFPFNYLICPLNLQWKESDAIPQLDQTTLLHDPRLIPHMLSLMQTMSDALPELGWGEVTEAKYREILDDHFSRFFLKTDLGYGMVHIVENGKAYMLQNPQISDEGYDEVVLNGVPTKLQGYKIKGEKSKDVMFMKGEGNEEFNRIVRKYHESLEKRYTWNIYDLASKYEALFEKTYLTNYLNKEQKPIRGALVSIDLEKQLNQNPKLLAQMLFVLMQIGRENIDHEDSPYLQMWLMKMIPAFSDDACWGTLIQLYKHQDKDRNAIRRQLLLIKDLNINPRIPFMLPFRFAVESEGIYSDISYEAICYID